MADTLQALQNTADVIATSTGACVTVDAEALAEHVSTFAIPTVEIDDNDPILDDLFGETEDDFDLFAD